VHLVLVGCGKMGSALLKGWLRHASASKIAIIDPVQPCSSLPNDAGFMWFKSPSEIPDSYHPAAIVIAVKPQHVVSVLPGYTQFKESVFLSIAAGLTTTRLSELLGNTSHAIVRAMPNLPASIGMGITGAFANEHVTPSQHKLCEKLLQAIGEVVWLNDEALIDAVTGLSGSGPAYVFALVEAMAAAGEQLGLPSQIAMQLARQTVAGGGALLSQSLESATALRQAVTSSGGTTEAALKHLLFNNGLNSLMLRAMKAATDRSKELAS